LNARAKKRRDILDTVGQGVRFGARMLAKHPGSTAVAVLILALGIGANTTVYSLVSALIFPSVPIRESGRVVRLVSESPRRGIYVSPLSETELAALKSSTQSFVGLAVYSIERFYLTGDEPDRLVAVRCTVNLFDLLGVEPVLGRSFVPLEATPGREAPVILSHRSWQVRFGADPAIVGRTVHLDGRAQTIVGVMPEDFWFASRDAEVWFPMSDPRLEGGRESRTLNVVGRLKDTTTLQTARTEVDVLSQQLAREHPASSEGWHISAMAVRANVCFSASWCVWWVCCSCPPVPMWRTFCSPRGSTVSRR
jgi:putative ABC transport system permease protein